MDRVSVIIPVYNSESTIDKCVQSVLSQTYSNIEIILVDDGSTDKSGEICRKYERRYSNVIYMYQQNQGVSAARNNGIQNATGKWIAFVDSDDYIDNQMYEKMLKRISETESDVCICGYFVVSGENVKQIMPEFPATLSHQDALKKYVPLLIGPKDGKSVLGSSTICLYRSDLINEYSFSTKLKLLEDTVFNLDVLMKADKICFCKESLYSYCVKLDSATNMYREDAVEQLLLVASELKARVDLLCRFGVHTELSYYSTIQGFYVYLLKNEKKKYSNPVLRDKVGFITKLPIFQEAIHYKCTNGFMSQMLMFLARCKLYYLIGALL